MATKYFFLDESGNLDFSPSGTRFYVLTCLSTDYIDELNQPLYALKHDLLNQGYDIEYFHATEDKQNVRNKVFSVLSSVGNYYVDSLIIEKPKTYPSLQKVETFYPRMYQYLLRYVFKRANHNIDHYVIITDEIPVEKKREAVNKGLKTTVKTILGKRRFSVLHHASKSHFYLQITDYCSWAIYRKWQHNDLRSYRHIEKKVLSEFDIFGSGTKLYY